MVLWIRKNSFRPLNITAYLFLLKEAIISLLNLTGRGRDTQNITTAIIDYQPPAKTWFIPSRHVYSGRDNNVIISLPDAEHKKYSIKFYEEDGTFLFELKKITEPYLTLDKVNFMHSGLFSFEIYENRIIIERHKVYIPKDGKPIPSLDEEGHEIIR